jgi:methionyl-tRNA formyltransferase
VRLLFAATDSIAVPLLEKLNSRGLVTAVFTTPDAPKKRGKGFVPTPVKVKAEELGLPVFTPGHLNRDEREIVKSLGVDSLLSFSYGRIFGPKFLSLFRYTFNVHPSALPLYRGCSPIFNAIRNNERQTAISVQQISLNIDEGDIYGMKTISLDGTETSESLECVISEEAPEFVLSILESVESIIPFPQRGDASYTGFIKKDDGRINWSDSAESIHALVRACYPWPKAWCMYNGSPFIIAGVHSSSFLPFEPCTEKPGTVVALDRKKGLRIATGNGYLYVSRVLPPMKKEMDAASFINGARDFIGTVLE